MSLTQLGSKTPVPMHPSEAALEVFEAPKCHKVVLLSQEFTSLCPITGQPDFCKVEIHYNPIGFCLESKSLKLFLHSFRNYPGFAEQIASYIADRVQEVLHALNLHVIVTTTPRGGIAIQVTAERHFVEEA